MAEFLIAWGTEKATTVMSMRDFVSAEYDRMRGALTLKFRSRDPKKADIRRLTEGEAAEAWGYLVDILRQQHREIAARQDAIEGGRSEEQPIPIAAIRPPGTREEN